MRFLVLLLSFFLSLPLALAGGDISISSEDVWFSQSPSVGGKNTTIYVTIHNNSSEDVKGTVKIFDEYSGTDVGIDLPFFIIAEKQDTVFSSAIFEGYGNHTLAIRIIPFDANGDDNSNNKTYKKIFIDGDLDRDGIADANDKDMDGDGVNNANDAFPKNPKEWEDSDKDGIGNNADEDDDNDGVLDVADDLPLDPEDSIDTDNDGIGNKKDDDDDNDGIKDDDEILTDPLKRDTDGDTIDDLNDPFPLDEKRSFDTDGDGISNFDDNDDDNDGVIDSHDAFPLDAKEWEDSDGDLKGNNSDDDDDNDGWSDEYELNISHSNPLHADSDKDGVLDPEDSYPRDPRESADNDGDRIGNNADEDDDNDGILDEDDSFPFDSSESEDSDNDGIGNNADNDDDNDGILDEDDSFPFDSSESEDSDNDGLGDNADPNDNNKGPSPEVQIPVELIQGNSMVFSSLSSYDEDGVIVETEWLSSEGQTGKTQIFETRFNESGKQWVELKLTDDQGEWRKKRFEFIVQKNPAPLIALGGLFAFILLIGISYRFRIKRNS